MRSEQLYLTDMIEAAEAIERFVADLDRDDFLQDELRQSAVIQKILVIGEAAGEGDLVEFPFISPSHYNVRRRFLESYPLRRTEAYEQPKPNNDHSNRGADRSPQPGSTPDRDRLVS